MPKILTHQDVQQVLALHPTLWRIPEGPLVWHSDQTLPSRRRKRRLWLTCSGCQTGHWVILDHVKRDRSHSCRSCSKSVTRAEVSEVLEKHSALWAIPHNIKWMADDLRQKHVWLRCVCKAEQWVRWSRLKEGKSLGCRTCRGSTHGKSNINDPLYAVWRSLKERLSAKAPWQNFAVFEEWARPIYSPGWRLKKIDPRQDFSPENCDFFPTKAYTEMLNALPPEKQVVSQSVKIEIQPSGGLSLPVGQVVQQ